MDANLNYTFVSEEPQLRESSVKKVVYACSVLIIGICLGTLLFWLINGGSFRGKSDGHSGDIVNDSEKFDCHPDWPISEEECIKRGCRYQAASDQSVHESDLIHSSYVGVPSCYFPRNFKGYEVYDLLQKADGIEAQLKRKVASGFPHDIQNIHLLITFIDGNILRIKIKDDFSERFEPDIPLFYQIDTLPKNMLYNIEMNFSGIITIKRAETGKVIFETDLSRLIFSDQFLQLSTITSSQYLYGLGEHKEGILKSFNWTRLTLFNQGDIPVPNRNLYGSHPFYLVLEPDGKANGLFFLNSNAIDAILQPTPAVTLRSIGGIFDFFVVLGPTPEDVVKQYTSIVGRTFMPPYWSLGFHISKYGYFTLNKTEEILQRNLEAGILIDVQWQHIDYMQRHLDFTYDPKNFSGLPEFVDKLHGEGRHYVAMISPGVSNSEEPGSYSPYDDGVEMDLFIKDVNGKYIEGKVWNTNMTVFPDFSNPATSSYWLKHFENFHTKLDFDGVWIDMNEPLNFYNGSVSGCPETSYDDPPYLPGRPYPLKTLTLCMSAKHNLTTHYNEHNLVAFREAKATYDAMVKIRKKRPFIISRATFSGQGVYSGHWSGDINSDWDDMRYSIPSMLIFNLYGMSMIGSDICGFRLNTTEELCARWQTLGAFYPFSRNHNDYDTFEQDPAALGPTVVEAAQYSLYIRYYLLPYLYTLFFRSHVFGETVVRPLFFEFTHDSRTYSIEEQFLWGPALMILPVLYPDTEEIKVYLPDGCWYDFQSGMIMKSSGKMFTLTATLNFINLAVRGGYILPLQIPGKTTTDSRQNAFDLLVALDCSKKASGSLYWDDGESLDTYKEESFNLIQFSANNNNLTTSIDKKNYAAEMKLHEIKVLGVTSVITNVTINGEKAWHLLSEHYLTINASDFTLLDALTVVWS